MSNGLENFLDAAGKLVNVFPTVYEDGLKPAVQETGQFIARIPRAINAALIGVDCWVEEKKYRLDETKKLLEIKLANVDPDKIVPPEPYVAIPALQAISYCMDSEELKNMFANLLANSMNIDFKASVHPAFVDLVKQLSPVDCSNLSFFSKAKRLPIARYDIEKEHGMISTIKNHIFISNPNSEDIDLNAVSISNILRLGLIEVTYGTILAYTPQYEDFKKQPFYIACYSMMPNNTLTEEEMKLAIQYRTLFTKDDYLHFKDATRLNVFEGFCELTPLGKSFASICCS